MMPRLRMPAAQQAIFDELADFAGGARMINAPQLARFWGRDVRCVREWLSRHRLARYPLGNGYGYMIRDVSRAMYMEQQAAEPLELLRGYGA